MRVHENENSIRFPVAMRLGVTPVPIPNTMVKTQAADGTMLETACESRWLPDYLKRYSGTRVAGKISYLENCIQKIQNIFNTKDTRHPRKNQNVCEHKRT